MLNLDMSSNKIEIIKKNLRGQFGPIINGHINYTSYL